MASYLLTWNASEDQLDWLLEQVRQFETHSTVRLNWSCGNTKKIREGDQVFFLRQRLEPRGLLAKGRVARGPALDLHWDEERKARGEQALYVDVVWDYFSAEPVIPRSLLNRQPYSRVHWNTQKSGISIPDSVASRLAEEFVRRTGLKWSSGPDEVDRSEDLHEGAVYTVRVNAYERSPRARADCLAHYGYDCQACGVGLESVYGPVAHQLIHVHHVKPLAKCGKDYVVDPIRDLIPVCPNCHAVIHRTDPPARVEDLRAELAAKPR